MSCANQRTIIIERASLRASDNYLKISKKNLRLAAFYLSGNALKLYLYLCSNTDRYKMFLFSSDFYKGFADISEKTYLKVFQELNTEGYLVQIDPEFKKNTFIFKEVSDKHKEIKDPDPPCQDVIEVVSEEEMAEYKEKIITPPPEKK